eukprot:8812253-Pyramimonas_sp.AAC.1
MCIRDRRGARRDGGANDVRLGLALRLLLLPRARGGKASRGERGQGQRRLGLARLGGCAPPDPHPPRIRSSIKTKELLYISSETRVSSFPRGVL